MVSYLHWHVGMKVVCIRATEGVHYVGDSSIVVSRPLKDRVYTLSKIAPVQRGAVLPNGDIVGRDTVTVGLVGFSQKVGWDAVFFRPVQERKTDISMFTAMLTPKREPEPV